MSIVENKVLAPYTSWRVGGPARFFTEATTTSEVRRALRWSQERTLPVLLLGGGTNLLICDEGFDGLVLRYRARSWALENQGTTGLLSLAAGTPIGHLAWIIGSQGWSNLEWAAGLPGSVGGAIYGNAGCYGGSMAGVLRRAWLLIEDQVQEWSVEHFAYGYRSSVLKQPRRFSSRRSEEGEGAPASDPDRTCPRPGAVMPAVILSAELVLKRQDAGSVEETMKAIIANRKERTPVGHSCGSVFKNPPGSQVTAGQLLDQAGLKGTRIGAAEISQRHANYLLNLGGARSDDILRLIELARNTVLRQFGIALELEIQVVGPVRP
ncbi:MAG: UDP-N-acetylmuramate dehydrogenase [Chloroflexaceae bacterium]|nr:UDP-N-acetylmuramate dehydrogenase [Chloroflexaceae bacterium]